MNINHTHNFIGSSQLGLREIFKPGNYVAIPRYYNVGGAVTYSLAANAMVSIPVYYPIVSISHIAAEIATAQAGSTTKMAIYEFFDNDVANVVKKAEGTIDATTTGMKTVTASLTLNGCYMISIVSTHAVGIRDWGGGSDVYADSYLGTTNPSTENACAFYTNIGTAWQAGSMPVAPAITINGYLAANLSPIGGIGVKVAT